MKFFSGFSLKNDREFFLNYIKESQYTVAGFSYGAIKAFEAIEEALKNKERVDTLQLFSPAFFQTKSPQFKKLQMRAYTKDEALYMQNFIRGCFTPYKVQKVQHKKHSLEELEELLFYEWSRSKLVEMRDQGVCFEVYLGGEDRITDVEAAREFFKEFATVTYIKNANHFLQRGE